MLDKATASVLSIVNDQCKEDIYVILKNEDITPQLSKKNKLSDEGIKSTIDYLAEREYIKLKHSQEGTYCLTMLPKGRLFNEEQMTEKYILKQENKRNLKFLFRISFLSALFSFLGAAIAVILVNRIL
ncbi:MAG: hypothetical protein PHC46_03095 [Clostridia bacterium]|nr:hypothetical protein [Clostridia bacterium]